MNNVLRNDRTSRAGGIAVWVLTALLLFAVGGAIWASLPVTAGEQVRRHLLEKFRAHYAGAYVDIASARFDPGRGIILEGLCIGDDKRSSQCRSLVRVERIEVHTDLSWQRLAALDVRATSILLHGVRIETQVDGNGRLSIEQFVPLPKFGPGADVIAIEDGSITITDAASQRGGAANVRPLEIREIRGRIRKEEFNGAQRQDVYVTGRADFFERLDLTAKVGADRWTIQTQLSSAHFNDDLVAKLPICLRQRLGKVTGLSTQFDAVAAIEGTAASGIDNWVTKVNIVDGQFESGYLPYRLDRLHGELMLRPEGAEATQLSGMIGDGRCSGSAKLHGWRWPCPLEFTFETDELLLHEGVSSCTPQKCQQLFQRFLPQGRIAAKANVAFDGTSWAWQSAVECLGLEIQFDRFPYPVKDIYGTIQYGNLETIAEELTGTIGGQPITCSMRLEKPNLEKNNVTSSVRLSMTSPLTIDETLVRSLTPRGAPLAKLESFARSLNASGKVTLADSRFESRADGTRSRAMDLRFEGGSLRYDKFPYPVFDVQGRVLVDDTQIQIVNVRGQSNDSATIQANGNCRLQPEGLTMQLDLDGYGVAMDQSLRRALTTDHQAIWDLLGPSGVLEHLHVVLSLSPENSKPELKITADQYERSDGGQRVVSITPKSFPYRLDITRGHAQMIGDRVTIRDLQGWHNQSRLHAQGTCVRNSDGRWVLSVDAQPPTRVLVDNDLLSSLPPEVQGTFSAMQLHGPPVSVRGSASFAFPDGKHPDLDFDWDLKLQFEGNRIGNAGPVHDLRGGLEIAGSRVNQQTHAAGSLQVDSMHVQGIQVVNVRGPLLIMEDQLYLGQAVNDGQVEEIVPTVNSVRGSVFRGVAELDGQMDLTSGAFDVNARFDNVDFATLLREFQQQVTQTTGTGRGVLRLKGLLGNRQTLSGQGMASLQDATLYELPVIVRLMNLLAVQPDQDGDLSNCELKFQVDGEELRFSDIRIWGDILVLRGEGSANLRRELDFRFETGVSPNNLWSRLLSPLKSQQYTLWTIDVTGTLSNPIFDKRAIKQIERALERLIPELETAGPSKRTLGRASRQDDLLR
ncbi:MAG: AsmA-like C-terminal region-containing protein [Pirellulaceae bacterium]